jgi:hypothetical protein
MKSHIHEIVAAVLVFIAILLPFHQRIVHGFWFHRQGIWNHEAIEACLFVFSVGLLLGKYLTRRWG